MAFQPNQEYAATISSCVTTQDKNGNSEIHVGVEKGKDLATYKLKFKNSDEKKKSLAFAMSFGADRIKLRNPAYLEQWLNGLCGIECFIRTKAWEIDNRSGVYIDQISPAPFVPSVVAIAKAFESMGQSEQLPVTDDDVPY